MQNVWNLVIRVITSFLGVCLKIIAWALAMGCDLVANVILKISDEIKKRAK